MAIKTSVGTNINAFKCWLVIIGDSFHLWSSNPSGKTMRRPLQCDNSSVLLRPSCWLNSTQHLLIGLIDFPACQPPLLQLLITMLDSGIGYLDRYVHSYTVSQRRGPFRCFNEPSAESLSAAGAVKRRHELGPFVQIKAKQFVRINGFIFFDTIVADKRRSLALGIFCCWAIRMALTGAAEGVSEARRPDGPGQSYGVCRGKAGVWRTDWPGFANRVKATLICKQHVKLNHAN